MLYDVWIYDDEPHKAEQDLIFVNLTKQELDFLVSISQRRGYVVEVYDSPNQQDWIGLSRLALAGQGQPACQAFHQWDAEIRT